MHAYIEKRVDYLLGKWDLDSFSEEKNRDVAVEVEGFFVDEF